MTPKDQVAFLNPILWLQTAPGTQGEEEGKREHLAVRANACRLKEQEKDD